MITYSIEIHLGESENQEHTRSSIKAILESVKSEFENKNKGNKFEYQERIFSDK